VWGWVAKTTRAAVIVRAGREDPQLDLHLVDLEVVRVALDVQAGRLRVGDRGVDEHLRVGGTVDAGLVAAGMDRLEAGDVGEQGPVRHGAGV